MLRVAVVTIGVIACLCLTTQARILQPDAANAPGGIMVTKYGATAADFPGYDTVELCSEACLDWRRSFNNVSSGLFEDACWDAGARSMDDLGDYIQPLCPLGTDCSACGPRTVVVFDTIQEAVGNFTNEDGVFDGSLYVESTSLTSLDGMQPVKRIAGSLALRYNAQLEDITSLRSLEYVDVLLLFQQNLLPGTLFGLESLADVGVKMDFNNNTLLETIENFDSLTEMTGGVYFYNHPALTSITMDNLRTVGVNLTGRNENEGYLISGNPMLKGTSLPSLQYVDYQLSVDRNDELSYVNVDNLVALGDYELFANGGPEEIVGPSTLVTIDILEIADSPIEEYRSTNTTKVFGFDNLLTIDIGLYIYSLDDLTSISGFDNLQTVGSIGLEITDNKVLYSLQGFSALTTISGDLRLNNTALIQFEAFENLEFVGGCCELEAAFLLSSLPACAAKLCE